MGSFDGKIGLVTGGASGIGRAVAERLAREGARVVVVDVEEDAGRAVADSVDGLFVRADVSNLDEVRAAVAEAVDRYGGLHFAHLNAGVSTGASDMTALSEADYRRAVGVNVDGVVFGVKAVAPVVERGAAIVATASLAGLLPYPGDPVYGLTKHAVIGFVRAVATQLHERGIGINAICPGFVDTPLIGPFAEEFRARGFPLLEPAEVARAVLEIAASGKTGEVFVCQPGRLCERYEFRGVPGPRVAGAEGKAPPFQPGA